MKLYERDILGNRPAITGRFRNWLYVAARHYAVDEWRKTQRRTQRVDRFEVRDAADSRGEMADDAPFDADEFYALSVLHMTVRRVHKHLLEEGKSEHWMIFEELVLARSSPTACPKRATSSWRCFPARDRLFSTTALRLSNGCFGGYCRY